MNRKKIQSFILSHKKSSLILSLVLIIVFAVFASFTNIVRASFGIWGDTSLIHACLNSRGIPIIVAAGTSCQPNETQATWIKDIDAGSGLTITRSSSGATLSLASGNTTTGWTASTDTWTYASANSFTISGADRTSTFTPGTRIQATNNSTTFYGTVANSSYASTTTTVSLVANSDYSLANLAITSPSYSYQANPQGYPGWFNYTPTWTGFSSNPTPVVSRFSIIGREVQVLIHCNGAGTSNSTSTAITLPTNAAQTVFAGFINNFDNGGHLANPGVATANAGTSTLNLYTTTSQNGWTASGGKAVTFSLTYEF